MFTFWRVEMVYTGSLSLHITRHCIQRHDTYDWVMSQIQKIWHCIQGHHHYIKHNTVHRDMTHDTALSTETRHWVMSQLQRHDIKTKTRQCKQKHDTKRDTVYRDTIRMAGSCHKYKDMTLYTGSPSLHKTRTCIQEHDTYGWVMS